MSTEDNTVAEQAMDELESIDDWARAQEIAERIGSTPDYTRQKLNELHDEGDVAKRRRGTILGTRINGKIYVLDSEEQAKRVLRLHGDVSEETMEEMSLVELRAYVREEIGEWTGPINRKAWYRRN